MILNNINIVVIILHVVKYSVEYSMGPEFLERYYIDDDWAQKSERICTQCSYDHPNCTQEFNDLWQKHHNWDDWWACNTDQPCPWDMFKETLMMDCTNMEPWKRKKRNARVASSAKLETEDRLLHRNKRQEQDGLIYINRAFHGKSYEAAANNEDCDAAHNSDSDYCKGNALYRREHLLDCLGKSQCWELGVPTSDICNSDQYSDFLQVDYQCIPENLVLAVDGYSSITSHVGYVTSTGYPYGYTPQCSYQCVITSEQSTLIHLKLEALHFDLENSTNGCCNFDWLEVQSINQEDQIVTRQRYCGYWDQGSMLDVSAATVRLLFETDHNVQKQGFWIKYLAYDGNSKALDVTMKCSSYDPTYDYIFESPEDVDTHNIHCYDGDTTEKDDSTVSSTTTAYVYHDTTTVEEEDEDDDEVSSEEDDDTKTTEPVDEYDTSTPDVGEHTTHSTPSLFTTHSTTAPFEDDNDEDDNFTEPEAQSSKSSAKTIGIAVGATVGGLVVIGGIITAVFCCRNRNSPSKPPVDEPSGPAYDNPYYLPAAPLAKPTMGKPSHTPAPFNNAGGVENPEYNSGYLYPVTQSPMDINGKPVDKNPQYDNSQYEEIPASVASFGVPTATGYEELGRPGNRDTVTDGSKGGDRTSSNAQEQDNVYQELMS